MRVVPFILLLAALAPAISGCRGSRVIEVSPPSTGISGEHAGSGARGSVAVLLETGSGSDMPAGIVSTTFRVTEIDFHEAGGSWVTRLSNRQAVSSVEARRTSVPLLATELAVMSFDSISVELDDVFVTYNENAGGPLVPEEQPVTLPLDLQPSENEASVVVLRYHPAESVRLDSAEYVWRFRPVFSIVEDSPR